MDLRRIASFGRVARTRAFMHAAAEAMDAPFSHFGLGCLPDVKAQIAPTSCTVLLLGAWWRKQQSLFPNSSIWERRLEVMRVPRVHRREQGESTDGP